MCGRYYIASEEDNEKMRLIIEEINRRYKDQPELEAMKTGEIAPTNVVPIYASNAKHIPMHFLMKWGFAPFETGGRPLINARSETANTSKTWKDALRERRCIIPASRYFEWEKKDNKKIKNAIWAEGQQIIYMAGIYRYEDNPRIPVFSILTREPAPAIAHIHNRMPVIMPPSDVDAWLSPDTNYMELLTHAQQKMEYVAV